MAILTTKKGLYQRQLGERMPAKHETLEEVRKRMIKEVENKNK